MFIKCNNITNLEFFAFSKDQLEEIRKKSILECYNWWGPKYSGFSGIIITGIMKYTHTMICNSFIYFINVNFHMLRHTYATTCIKSGMPAKVVQKKLGYRNISITLNKKYWKTMKILAIMHILNI